MQKYNYESYVKLARDARTRQMRFQWKELAKEHYSDKFNENDFTFRKYRYKTYEEMVKLYNEKLQELKEGNTKEEKEKLVMDRCTIKRKAKQFHPDKFKEEDFPKTTRSLE